MLKTVVQTVTSLASDAYSSLVHSTDRAGPTTATNETSSSIISEVKASSSLSRKTRPSMSEEHQPYTRSVSRFWKELEEEEQVGRQKSGVEEEVHEPNQDHSGSEPKRINSGATRRYFERSDERRALGIPERSPPDAVKIAVPLPRSTFRGGFQPLNTLEQHRSAKGQYYFDHRYKDVDLGVRREQSIQKARSLHENNHDYPNKRTRTGPSPVIGSSERHAINVDDSQDNIVLDNLPRSSNVVAEHPKELSSGGLERIPKMVQVNLPPRRHEQSHHIVEELPTTPPTGLSRTFERYELDSPDELSHDFIKTARQQRLQEFRGSAKTSVDVQSKGVGQTTKKRMDRILTSSSPPPTKEDMVRHRRNPISTPLQQSSTSRMDRRLQAGNESPDALLGECTVVSPANKHDTKPREHNQNARADPNVSSPKPHTRKRPRRSSETSPEEDGKHVFPLKHYIYYNVPSGDDLVLVVHERTKICSLEFSSPKLGPDSIFQIPVDRFIKTFSSATNESARVMIMTNSVETPKKKLFFQFLRSEHVQAFQKVIDALGPPPKHVKKSEQWIEEAFDRGVASMLEITKNEIRRNDQFQPSQHNHPASKTSHYFPAGRTGVQKARMIDRLDQANVTNAITAADRLGPKSSNEDKGEKGSTLDSANIEAPKTLSDVASKRRTTRSTRSQSNKVDDLYGPESTEPKRASVFGTLSRWKKPLVYPYTGRKRETVLFDDLQRLDEDEFLNDNLVSLFIRYLEEHANKEQMKRIHFFNSFLFVALTKDVKSRRDVNFDSVRKWTAKVDLFNRDFVVVPVNEHLHWFVMIICNLSYFRRKYAPKAEDEEDDNEIIRSIQSATTAPNDGLELILKSDLEDVNEASARSSFADMSLDDEVAINSSPGAVKSSANTRGRKKQRRPLQKHDVDKPIIITLDSLDQPRSTTASLLRQYIVAEAKDKKGWEIDGREIKGMTAKGIPHQDNFSDCGLYLCMYLEQFVLDPYSFVRRILQRDDKTGWPKKIESSDLRERLRDMLLRLYEQQQSQEQRYPDIPALGSILVELDEPAENSHMAGVDKVKTAEKAQDKDGEARTNGRHDRFSSDNEVEANGPLMINSIEDWKLMVNNPIAIDDDDDPRHQSRSSPEKQRTQITSHYFSEPNHTVTPHLSTAELKQSRQTDPVMLAEYLQKERSPERLERNERRRSRSQSASTDYLTGTKSYKGQYEQRSPRSPAKSSGRKDRQRFKKQRSQEVDDAVEIEESEFEGFPDPIKESMLQHSAVAGHLPVGEDATKRNSKKRKVLGDVTADNAGDLQIDDDTREGTQMLV